MAVSAYQVISKEVENPDFRNNRISDTHVLYKQTMLTN